MASKARYPSAEALAAHLRVARGQEPADLVLKRARFLDVFSGAILEGDVAVHGEVIVGTQQSYRGRVERDAEGLLVVPGFIDAHVHIESSLLTPARFQQAVLPCGTTTAIWDPHEIANVRGLDGLSWALAASEGLDLDVFVMLSSCVPSTSPQLGLETSGASLSAADLLPLRGHRRVLGLAEVMNYPGLLAGEPAVLDKLLAFQDLRRDGHCPGLRGRDLNAYGAAGIHSCHESTSLDEAREKLQKGVHVLIREGSCAKDADALLPLLDDYASAVVGLCTDDRNPADVAREGHVSAIVDKALRAGHSPQTTFRSASFAAARAYGLGDRGAVAPGFLADLCLVRPADGGHWSSGLSVEAVYKRGRLVDARALAACAERRAADRPPWSGPNLRLAGCTVEDLAVACAAGRTEQRARLIGVRPRQLLTDARTATLPATGGRLRADPPRDILKLAVFERHRGTGGRTVGFVQGFGLQRGAIAMSITHDSHNVIVVGADDRAMAAAVDRLCAIDGGVVVAQDENRLDALALPIGGLMCDRDPRAVAGDLDRLKGTVRALGGRLEEPFVQLSFLALPVIPSLKLTDRGLVDVASSCLIPVTC